MLDFRAIRRELGVTQEELAEQLGLHQSTISRLEKGRLEVDERTRLALEALRARKRVQDEAEAERGVEASAQAEAA